MQAWQAEVEQHFTLEIQHHFAAEEREVFPVARQHVDLGGLVDELLAEHVQLRDYFERAKARELDGPTLRQFAELLSRHIRKEERQLFEQMQRRLNATEREELGVRVEKSLASVAQACIAPTEEIL
jgi:hemerythrin-like domain-containing protein